MITLSGRAIEKLKESNIESSKNALRVFISGMG
jgi:Fe-S cluster assembly iron-binding protein IscA